MGSPRDDFIPVLKTGMKSSRSEHIFAPNHVNTSGAVYMSYFIPG